MVLAASLVLAVAAPAQGSGIRSFELEGSCVQASVGFAVDAERARRHVPARFPVLEVAGKALVAAWGADCELSVQDGPVFPGFLGGVLVFLQDGTVYDVTAVSSSREHYVWAGRLGLGDFVRRARVEYEPAAGTVGPVAVSVPGGRSPFSFSGTLAEPPVDPLAAPLTTVHWFQGRHGLIRGTYDHTFADLGAGNAMLRAAPGSPLADMLGGEEADGPASLFRFDFTGIVELAS